MPSTAEGFNETTREELPLKARRIAELAVDYIREHGLADFQLRTFAPSIGTTHRMVIHYFGSKDRLLAEVFYRLRLEDVSRFRQSTTSARQLVLGMWDYFAADDNSLRTCMYFQLLGSAFQDPHDFVDFLDSHDTWGDFLAELARREGYDPADAETRARVVLSGWRGLLIELYSKHNRQACEEALYALLDTFFPAIANAKRTATS
jgi:AcrR family transcriptional regulator